MKKMTTDGPQPVHLREPWPEIHMFLTRKRKSGKLSRHIEIKLKKSG
jgi:hypothetical protein